MDIEKDLLKERQLTEKYIQAIEKKMALKKTKVGDKRLTCSTSNKTPQYRIDGKYVSKRDLSEVRSIAQLKYDATILEVLKDKLAYINKLLPYYSECKADYVYESMCEGRQRVVTPYDMQRNKFIDEWVNKVYEPYDRWDDVRTEFYTSRGERVRSKAEVIIANELASYNVPYRYEYPLELLDCNKKRTYRPDFTALNKRTLGEFVIEHLGMMDKLGYYNANLNKIDVMERNGYLLGVNLLVLHETSENSLNVMVVRKYIEEFLI